MEKKTHSKKLTAAQIENMLMISGHLLLLSFGDYFHLQMEIDPFNTFFYIYNNLKVGTILKFSNYKAKYCDNCGIY